MIEAPLCPTHGVPKRKRTGPGWRCRECSAEGNRRRQQAKLDGIYVPVKGGPPRKPTVGGPPRRKPKPEAQPCQCGCGKMARPGSRYLRGHHLNRTGQRPPGTISQHELEAAARQPVIVACAWCSFRVEAPNLDAGRIAHIEHRLAEHPEHSETAQADVAQRRAAIRASRPRTIPHSEPPPS